MTPQHVNNITHDEVFWNGKSIYFWINHEGKYEFLNPDEIEDDDLLSQMIIEFMESNLGVFISFLNVNEKYYYILSGYEDKENNIVYDDFNECITNALNKMFNEIENARNTLLDNKEKNDLQEKIRDIMNGNY